MTQQTKPLARRIAAVLAPVPPGRVAVFQHIGFQIVLRGDHPDFDQAEQQAAQLPAPNRGRQPYLAVKNDDGTVTIYRGDREHPSKTRWTIPLGLPPVDEDANAYLKALRAERLEIGRKLAHAELGAAARIIVELFGATATRLRVAKDETTSGDTTITPLVLFDADKNLLWFNPDDHRYHSPDYPGAEHIQIAGGRPAHDVDRTVIEALAAHTEAAYDVVEGCGHALDSEPDDYYGPDVNTLDLDIPAALLPWYMLTYPGPGPE